MLHLCHEGEGKLVAKEDGFSCSSLNVPSFFFLLFDSRTQKRTVSQGLEIANLCIEEQRGIEEAFEAKSSRRKSVGDSN